MKHIIALRISCILTVTICTAGFAQNAYFGYIEEPTNPRSVALGGSGTAGTDGSFSFYNPATAASIERSFVAFEYGQQWSDLTRGLVETAWRFPRWFIGLSFQTQDNTFQLSDATGVLPGTGAENASMASLLFGWYKERYAIGAAINGFQHHLFDKNSLALSFSGGITVSVLPDHLTLGVSVLHAGGYYKGFYDSTFSFERDSLAMSVRGGAGWNDTIAGNLPLHVNLDVAYSSNYQRILVPVGIELVPLPPLSFRIGKRFKHPTDLFSIGIGISWKNLGFNATLTPTTTDRDIETKWVMGLRYALPSSLKVTGKISVDTTVIVPSEKGTGSSRSDTTATNDTAASVDTTVTADTTASYDTITTADTTVTADTAEAIPSTVDNDSLASSVDTVESGVPENPAADSIAAPESIPPVNSDTVRTSVPPSVLPMENQPSTAEEAPSDSTRRQPSTEPATGSTE